MYLSFLLITLCSLFFQCYLLAILCSVIVVRFNQDKAIPDVHQDDLLITYVQSYAPINEIGFRYVFFAIFICARCFETFIQVTLFF